MKIFIDSAKLDEIKLAKEYGILDGVTTNPSLIKKAVDSLKEKGEDIDIEKYIKQILITAKGKPVSLEVIGSTYEEIVKEGKILFKKFNRYAKNVYIKVPVNPSLGENNNFDGIRAIKKLSEEGIPVNCTLIFTPEQALLAAKAGAKLLSPFAGRVDDFIRKNNRIKFEKTDYYPEEGLKKGNSALNDNGIVSGIDLVRKCVEIMKNYNLKAEVLAASIRNPRQVREAALAGAHIATLPFGVIQKLLIHEKTKEGMKNFMKDVVPEYRAIIYKE